MSDKPTYIVPSMREIAELTPNGLRFVSTFSGCGGSCLGFRMAGWKTLWASEFIEEARTTYLANHPGVHVDARDIREVQPEDVLSHIGLRPGELDLLEGSPPCASFSTAGKREKGWGKVKNYSDKEQRADDLFFEYVRLLRGLQPRAFVAENVSGLVKGTAKGYFKLILQALKDSGYRVGAKVLDAQWLGVPQARSRLIFIGMRDDLKTEPEFPRPLPYRYSLREALPWLLSCEGGWGMPFENKHKPLALDKPSSTILGTAGGHQFVVQGAPTAAELAEVDITRFAIGAEWNRIRPGEASDKYFNLVKVDPQRPCPTVTQTGGCLGAAGVAHPFERRKFTIGELRRICAFPSDFVLTGSYSQQWERLGRAVPPVMMKHIAGAVRDTLLRIDGRPAYREAA